MTSVDRTAYPRLNKPLSEKELASSYTISESEFDFIRQHTRSPRGQLNLASMLKTRQHVGYFMALSQIPPFVTQFLADQLALPASSKLTSKISDRKAEHRYKTFCRQFLGSQLFTKQERQHIVDLIHQSAYTMSDPADLINVALEQLSKNNIELPAFSTLERMTGHERQRVHDSLYQQVTRSLTTSQRKALDALLLVNEGEQTTGFSWIKQTPGPATFQHFHLWADRLALLDNIIDPIPFFRGVAYTKVRQFATEATAYSIGDMRGIRSKPKLYTLLLSQIFLAQSTTRDEVITMFLRRMKRVVHSAQEKLQALQEKHREKEEHLITLLGEVIQYSPEIDTDEALGLHVRKIMTAQGGLEAIRLQVNEVSACHNNNYFPFLWGPHTANRSVIFQLLELLQLRSSTQNDSLINALAYVRQHRKTRKPKIPADIDICFASQRWRTFVCSRENGQLLFDRRALEICVFVHLSEALQCGDIYVEHSNEYADYRDQLLPWDICQERLSEYCQSLELPDSGASFVTDLQKQLIQAAEKADRDFTDNSELSIDTDGIPHLKQRAKSPGPAGLKRFKSTVYSQMPEHHLLDILKNVQHWTQYHKNFGPSSGSSPKLPDPTCGYLFAVFGFGCNLGASQTARHAPVSINRQTLRRINTQHTNAARLQSALEDIIDEYARFDLPGFWGKSNVAIADGTQIELRKNNLTGEQHIRYGGYAGIAYHHISSEYVALFSHFISCGVWEAVYILDALLLNRSVYKTDTLHADTQGQSEPVFALAHLLGIKLYPRMRNWNDVTFYRPSNETRYKHIDSLFTKTIDWALIQTHWQDLMQVVLSVQAGKVLPSMLLRKLNSNNRRNKLYRALRELGRVIRTLFLLRYLSEADFRQIIRAETTKVESYNDFRDWITFSGEIIKSGNPAEQEKQLKYTDIIANAIMLHNVSDLTDTLNRMSAEGCKIRAEQLLSLSPYIRDHIRRFGKYNIDMTNMPSALNPGKVSVWHELTN
ncbi:Tn3 family transposase [Enterobacter bugandensis]|uniref:Tn3 family transposase n=1 Tax=Enterobacter bugandensis TaxID=881260 RepID=UPI00235E829A|nr:Tn3 family transposase [Enterobacter bugandensis]